MESLAPYCENRAFLLCSPYKDHVLCIYKVGADQIRIQEVARPILRGRGTVFPLFRGAGSQAILAHLPTHTIKSLYLAHASEIDEAGLGSDWKALLRSLGSIRKQGYARTVGRMQDGMYSLAVPVIKPGMRVAGSLLMLGDASPGQFEADLDLVPMLQAKSAAIAAALGDEAC
ncbi:IclR family transcriptional regulator domain-containing protein [Verticiella sediminum]|nr:IclR family transcriptional regulator C-terminal domain-containing protein [Verticiella sediminum]